MLKDITIGQYFPGKSVVHRLDPRIKIIITIAFIVMLFVADSFYGIGIGVVFVLGSFLLSGIPFKMMLKSIKPLLPHLLYSAFLYRSQFAI